MRIKLLGTGNAAGMPLYGCKCRLCVLASTSTKLGRGPASAFLEIDGKKYLIDAGMMGLATNYPSGSLNGIFLTHFHPDHVQGLFHIRWGIGNKIPVFCPPDSVGCADLYKHPGILEFQTKKKFDPFELDNLRVTPLPLIHSKVTFGYVFEYKNKRVAYLTDTKGLPPKTLQWLVQHPLDVLVIDTSYPPGVEDSGHNNLNETLEIHRLLNVKKTVLTHIGHDLDVWLDDYGNMLPKSVVVAHDGLELFS